jgi:N-acetylglucosamine-6-sulfatase
MNKQNWPYRKIIALLLALPLLLLAAFPSRALGQSPTASRQRASANLRLPRLPGAKPRNIIFILTDDHRYDALSLMNHPFLQTPNLDGLAQGGVHLRNAFVTTSLCSPSRASVLTGQYAHRHRVIDNNYPVPPGLVFFPQYLKQAGYRTAFVGKWHMGSESDDPQPGFDHWVSFKGQGTYLPSANGLNVNGKKVPQKVYITDELTDYAVDWLKSRRDSEPFFLYLSHKAVHVDVAPGKSGEGQLVIQGQSGPREFVAAERHKGRYKNQPFTLPPSYPLDCCENAPMWVRNQRNSWHGADFAYYSISGLGEYYRQYAETLLGVDESVGRIVNHLRGRGLLDSTLIVYMGDNGFAFGEHGMFDKRTAYEESMRVPMLMHCPELFSAGTKVERMVANIDIAPTLLEAAGLRAPATMDGRSFIALAQGKNLTWRDALLYEYFWERNYPQTPTIHAVRTDRWKYVHPYGLWDVDELYDLQNDPREMRNLINDPAHKQTAMELSRRLFDTLEQTGGMYLPLYPDRGQQMNFRHADGPGVADFPAYLKRSSPGGAKPK